MNRREGFIRSHRDSLNSVQDVIIINVDKHEDDKDHYIWNSVHALFQLGFIITVFSYRNCPALFQNNICRYVQIGDIIPRTIRGFFRSVLYALRSMYIAFRVACTRNFKGKLCILNCDPIAVPILRFIGGSNTIFLSHYREIFSDLEIPENISRFERMHNRFLLSYSSLILVPCDNSIELVTRLSEDLEDKVFVLYLPAEGEMLPSSSSASSFSSSSSSSTNRPHSLNVPPYGRNLMPTARQRAHLFSHLEHHNRFSFLAIGPFEPQSNFDVLVEAFYAFLSDIEVVHHVDVTLEITGTCLTPEQNNYFRFIEELVASPENRQLRIRLTSNPSLIERCRLYRSCNCVLNANETDRYLPSIIEAFYFGRIVVSSETDFVIQNDVTGIMIPLNVNEFARVMYDVTFADTPAYRFIAMAAYDEYENLYSFDTFMFFWNQYISRIC